MHGGSGCQCACALSLAGWHEGEGCMTCDRVRHVCKLRGWQVGSSPPRRSRGLSHQECRRGNARFWQFPESTRSRCSRKLWSNRLAGRGHLAIHQNRSVSLNLVCLDAPCRWDLLARFSAWRRPRSSAGAWQSFRRRPRPKASSRQGEAHRGRRLLWRVCADARSLLGDASGMAEAWTVVSAGCFWSRASLGVPVRATHPYPASAEA